MYELADWGRPAPPEWVQRRELIQARLPDDLVRQLRARARAEGMPLTAYLEQILTEAVDPRTVLAAVVGEHD